MHTACRPLLVILALLQLPAADDLPRDLTWWQPAEAGGWTAVGRTLGGAVALADGRVGPGFAPGAQGAAIPAAGVLAMPRGTWAAWVRRRPGELPRTWPWLAVQGSNFVVDVIPGNGVLFFRTGGQRDTVEGFQWDYGVSSRTSLAWQPGTWHHVAITWDLTANQRVLWLDGQRASAGTSAHGPKAFGGENILKLGGSAPGPDFDEVMAWKRPLEDAEIVRLAAQPEVVAQAVATHVAAQPRQAAWPIELPVLVRTGEDLWRTIAQPGQLMTVTPLVRNPGATPWKGTIAVRWLDWRERTVASQQLDLDLAAGAETRPALDFTPPERGVFKLQASLVADGLTLVRDLVTVAAVPQPDPQRPPGFFGGHVNSWSADIVRLAQRMGVRQVRGHDMLQATWWPRVEQVQGTFDWKMAPQIARWRAGQVGILGTFFGTPWWAAAAGPLAGHRGGGDYPSGAPPDLAAFRRYVRATVERYRQDIHAWEVWNEPEVSMFWQGTPEALARLVTAAAEEAKATDPGCTVMAAGFTSSWTFHQAFAAAGGLNRLDAISFHPYGGDDDHTLLWRDVAANVGHYRDLARDHLGRELPLWATEGGMGDDSWLHGVDLPGLMPEAQRDPGQPRRAAARLVLTAAMFQELGVERWFTYFWNPVGSVAASNSLQYTDATNVPKFKAIAQQTMAELVDGLVPRGSVLRTEGRLRANLWESPAGTIVLWCTGREAAVVPAPVWPGAVVRRLDLMGNPCDPAAVEVHDEPVWLEIAAPPAAVRAALVAMPIAVRRPARALPADQDPQIANHGVPVLPRYAPPAERPEGIRYVDLTPLANAGFHDEVAGDGAGGWTDEGPHASLTPAPVGTQTWHGVPFRIASPALNAGKAVITLQGALTSRQPQRAGPLPVDLGQVRCLYLLSAATAAPAGSAVGTMTVGYADGQAVEVALTMGRNLGDWRGGYLPGEESKPVPLRVQRTRDGRLEWAFLRVWEWPNPRPEVAITSLAFASAGGPATPIIIAVTAVGR